MPLYFIRRAARPETLKKEKRGAKTGKGKKVKKLELQG